MTRRAPGRTGAVSAGPVPMSPLEMNFATMIMRPLVALPGPFSEEVHIPQGLWNPVMSRTFPPDLTLGRHGAEHRFARPARLEETVTAGSAGAARGGQFSGIQAILRR